MLSAVRAGAISARCYALIEGESGRLLNGQNTSAHMPMASTTKIMPGLLAFESGKLNETFTVSADAIRVEGSSMGLVAGETLTLRDITYGLLLESGNDAANVIAYILGGSIAGFAEQMNDKARALGLSNTHYENPSGLDGPEHYTSALDLARLGAIAMKNPEFATIVSTYKKQVPYNGIQNGRTLVNHNELLRMYDGTLGIKTGFTKKSGRCLVTCAKRGDVTLVAATLNGPDDWNDHIALMDYGFGALKRTRLLASKPVVTANVVGGVADTVACRYDDRLEASLTANEAPRVVMHTVLPPFVYASVEDSALVSLSSRWTVPSSPGRS
jgi:D-alanyl-D-alanine carboxypeptidase